MANPALSDSPFGNYIRINGERYDVRHHSTDFTIMFPDAVLHDGADIAGLVIQQYSQAVARVSATGDRDQAMDDVRRLRPSYHVYLAKPANGDFADGAGEVLITDQLFVVLGKEDPELLQELISRFHLERAGSMGAAHILRITAATGE